MIQMPLIGLTEMLGSNTDNSNEITLACWTSRVVQAMCLPYWQH